MITQTFVERRLEKYCDLDVFNYSHLKSMNVSITHTLEQVGMEEKEGMKRNEESGFEIDNKIKNQKPFSVETIYFNNLFNSTSSTSTATYNLTGSRKQETKSFNDYFPIDTLPIIKPTVATSTSIPLSDITNTT